MFNTLLSIFSNGHGARAPQLIQAPTAVVVEGSPETGDATPLQHAYAYHGLSKTAKATSDRLSMPHPLGHTV